PDQEGATMPDGIAIDADQMLATFDLSPELRQGVRPGLEAGLAALRAEPDLGETGRARTMEQFGDNLRRLAQIDADRCRHPEIAEVAIDRPVFILGLPRCGTSLLHALIGSDPAVRTPLSWEVAMPS